MSTTPLSGQVLGSPIASTATDLTWTFPMQRGEFAKQVGLGNLRQLCIPILGKKVSTTWSLLQQKAAATAGSGVGVREGSHSIVDVARAQDTSHKVSPELIALDQKHTTDTTCSSCSRKNVPSTRTRQESVRPKILVTPMPLAGSTPSHTTCSQSSGGGSASVRPC